jgi:hypothetical protein
VQEETGGRAYYERTEIKPDWPGGASGVTIGIGYDLGYCTAAELAADWAGALPASMISELAGVVGIKGSPAHSHAQSLRGAVCVPWDAAIKVFTNVDVPRWTAAVLNALPNARLLSKDSLGALLSLTFNRGASFNLPGDRYREMRAIRDHMMGQNYTAIPAEFRSMKRIWPLGTADHTDLTNRREHEAVLFERGLQQ